MQTKLGNVQMCWRQLWQLCKQLKRKICHISFELIQETKLWASATHARKLRSKFWDILKTPSWMATSLPQWETGITETLCGGESIICVFVQSWVRQEDCYQLIAVNWPTKSIALSYEALKASSYKWILTLGALHRLQYPLYFLANLTDRWQLEKNMQ